jgi:hypothetical protein
MPAMPNLTLKPTYKAALREAKDSTDDLDKEIKHKFFFGYSPRKHRINT